MTSDGGALTSLSMENQKYHSQTLLQQLEVKELPVFEETKRWLDIGIDKKIALLSLENINLSDFFVPT